MQEGDLLTNGRYRIERHLGDGGMGQVYRARDLKNGTVVVIKIPRRSMLDEPDFLPRFRHEVRALLTLDHPRVVRFLDEGAHEGIPFVVMEYLPGGSLDGRMERARESGRAMPALDGWLSDIAMALDEVHRQGMIHRDVKPANVLFDGEGSAFLADFGIAKAMGGEAGKSTTLTATGKVVGTPDYMAPELIMGKSLDGRVDQYALGVMVFETLAGRKLFEDATNLAVMVKHTVQAPPDLREINPAVPSHVARAVNRALAKNPSKRFPTCLAFARAVLAPPAPGSEESDLVTEESPTNPTPSKPPVRRGQVTPKRSPSSSVDRPARVSTPVRTTPPLQNQSARPSPSVGPGQDSFPLIERTSRFAAWVWPVVGFSASLMVCVLLALMIRGFWGQEPRSPLTLSREAGVEIRQPLVSAPRIRARLAAIAEQKVPAGTTLKVELALTAATAELREASLTFELGANAPPGASIDRRQGLLTWKPSLDQAGTSRVLEVLVRDQDGEADRQRFNLLITHPTGPLLQLTGHAAEVYCVAVSADGGRALTGSADRSAKLWDLATGACLRTYEGHGGPITCVAFSPDGQAVMTGSTDRTARVWNLTTGQVTLQLTGHSSWVNGVAFLGSSKVITASGGRDQSIRVWDLPGGSLSNRIDNHFGWVRMLSVGVNGQSGWTVGVDRSLRQWDLVRGVSTRTLEPFPSQQTALTCSTDGQTALAVGADHSVWLCLPSESPRQITELPNPVLAVALSADNRSAVLGDVEGNLRIWDLSKGQSRVVRPRVDRTRINALALIPQSPRILIAGSGSTALVWGEPSLFDLP